MNMAVLTDVENTTHLDALSLIDDLFYLLSKRFKQNFKFVVIILRALLAISLVGKIHRRHVLICMKAACK